MKLSLCLEMLFPDRPFIERLAVAYENGVTEREVELAVGPYRREARAAPVAKLRSAFVVEMNRRRG